ncbi:tetratricopeptide repeat protein [Nocardia sp. NPDC004582]
MSEKIEKARVLGELGRYEAARELLAEVLASEPDNADALAEMAEASYQLDEYERALEYVGRALRLTPDSVYVWEVRALTELQCARAASGAVAAEWYARAVASARRGAELTSGAANSFRILAATQRDTDPTAALANIDRALELEPDNAQAHLLRGVTLRLHRRGRKARARAEASFREALRLSPEHPEALYQLALLTLRRGERERGASELRRVAALDPSYGDAVRPLLERLARLPAPVRRSSARGGRFGRWAAIFAVLIVIRLGIAALGADHDSAPATTHYPPPLYTAPPTLPSYLRQYPLTVAPMPSRLEYPPTYLPPQNFPTYRPPAPR